jgi:2-polyprenyl-3-methyl-5-hydroxy-6-metoxy-1,4-benzoquinol methylase
MVGNTADLTERYTGEHYLAENPTWHEEDAPWKSKHIENILARNGVEPTTICEIGCGTGAIVEILARHRPQSQVEGFEIAPPAFERSLARRSANLDFALGSPFGGSKTFDLSMAIDVIEHVENPFDFARSMKDLSTWQVLHIPLDMNALATARGWVIMDARNKIGHLHYFTRDTALALLDECGLKIVDSFYTPWAIDQSSKTWKKRLAAYPRRLAFSLAPDATVRAIGGWSLMVLTRSR